MPVAVARALDASLKDGASVKKAADLVVSVRQKALEGDSKYGGTFVVSLSWKLGDNDIDVNINCRRDPDDIRSEILRAINPGGEPKAFRGDQLRSEERRVGKECRSRWSPYH